MLMDEYLRRVEGLVAIASEPSVRRLGGGWTCYGHHVPPDDNLVLRVAVRRDELIDVLRPAKVAHLAACVDAIKGTRRLRVPKADAAVGGAAARGEEAILVRRPRDGLDGGRVLVEPEQLPAQSRRREMSTCIARSGGRGGVCCVCGGCADSCVRGARTGVVECGDQT